MQRGAFGLLHAGAGEPQRPLAILAQGPQARHPGSSALPERAVIAHDDDFLIGAEVGEIGAAFACLLGVVGHEIEAHISGLVEHPAPEARAEAATGVVEDGEGVHDTVQDFGWSIRART
jgi:hypothetical protein